MFRYDGKIFTRLRNICIQTLDVPILIKKLWLKNITIVVKKKLLYSTLSLSCYLSYYVKVLI